MGDLFFVLEPGNHLYLVIEAARRRGLTVVACHSRPLSPPAPFNQALQCISHYVPVAGWRDSDGAFETIVSWCGQRRVAGTYAGYEITLRMNARLRQHFGLPGAGPEKMDLLLNKVRVRAALRQASLSRLRVVEDDALRRMTEWPFPGRSGFLKPVNGQGSIYVRRCSSLADVREHYAEWDANVRRNIKQWSVDHLRGGHGMFLEEEAVGELVSVEGYCYRGRYTALGITDRTVLARDVAIEMGNTFPCPHPRRDEIFQKVRAIHECLGVPHGATHAELMIGDDGGEIELVELNVRFGGGDILVLLDHAYEVQFEDDLVALGVGEAPSISLPDQPRRYVCGQDFLAPADLRRFESIDIPGDDVFFRKVYIKPGTVLESTNFQNDHIAAYAVTADSYAGALARASAIRSATAINGVRLEDDPNNVVVHCAERWAARDRR
jgi:biotin carboxylase